MKYCFVHQHDEKGCGVACLSMVLQYYGLKYPLSIVRKSVSVNSNGASIYSIIKSAEDYGFHAEGLY